jgi:hypothetical protein
LAFVVFAGQSNALGFGMSRATLPAEYSGLDWLTWIWNNQSGGWEPLMPGVNTGTPANPEAWGPEVAFAHEFRLAHPDEMLIIVKSAKGSTGLAADPARLDWSPQSDGEMFDLTAERIAAARASISWPDVDAVFLFQGETDAWDPAASAAYADNLRDWFSAIRAEWMGDPDGEIVFGRINDSGPYFETVRWAQYVVDAQDPHAASFDTYDQAMQGDGVHYAALAFLEIGETFHSLWDAQLV